MPGRVWGQSPGATGEGVLAVARAGGVNRLLISGHDDAGLGRATALIANGELLRQAEEPA